MRTVNKSALVPYTALQMYRLVNHVARYPEFLPWCRHTEILSETPASMRATLELARGGLHKTFTTSNRLDPGQSIVIALDHGPFRHLEGHWRFEDFPPDGSKVSLNMEFEFAGAVLDLIAGPVFHEICNSLVTAFTRRATVLYGKHPDPKD
ncbi:MAG: type II toxin-antitoxin system RatA family toxin [Gammaproteobacteria bacterium]